MKALTLYWLDTMDQLNHRRATKESSLQSPALSLLSQQCIDSSLPAILAQETFRSEWVSAKLVVNQEHQLLGIVSAAHLSEQNILRLQSEQRIPRAEILIHDLMQARADILVMDYQDIQTASVYDVAVALKAAGQPHCLVVDRGAHIVHGFFSIQDVVLDKTLLPYEENAVNFIQLHHVAVSV